jgi:hypothetical protein
MNETERYVFDLNGYLVVKGCLEESERKACLAAAEELEAHVAEHADDEPQLVGFADLRYRFDEKYHYHSYKSVAGGGVQYVVDDFLNASPAFDVLVNHERTMDYVRELAVGPYRIGSSELRYRHRSNRTDTHMGGKMDVRNRYQFVGSTMYDGSARKWRPIDFDLLAVRILYALHDIPVENGPLCVVPGSHKSNYFSPFDDREPTAEPFMVPIPLQAGDAIIFTENLRHGGHPNSLDRSRKTIHLMIGPDWAGSQSPIHWNDHVYVSREAWERYSEAQRALLPLPAEGGAEFEMTRLRGEIQRLKSELANTQSELQSKNRAEPDRMQGQGVLGRVRRALQGK